MDGPIPGHILPALSKLSGLKKKKAAHEIGREAMGRTGREEEESVSDQSTGCTCLPG